MMCLCDAIDHADGLSRLHKIQVLDKVASNQVYVKPEILPPTSVAYQQHSLKFYFNISKWKGPIEVINVHDYG